MSHGVQTNVRLDEWLKATLDSDDRPNKEVIESALIREFGGEDPKALERRYEEHERQISLLKTEINERKREIENRQMAMEAIERQLHAIDQAEEWATERVREFVDENPEPGYPPAEADNPAISKWAEKADMSPSQFAEAVRDEREARGAAQ